MTSAISAVRRQVREMVDGTLEIKLHVSPIDKAAFHQLFPEIDMPVALAPLKPEATLPKAEPERVKPGPLCVLAINWCKDAHFQNWLWLHIKKNCDWTPPATMSEQNAKMLLCSFLEIISRLQLDGDEQAANRFQTLIRLPYMKYQQTGVVE